MFRTATLSLALTLTLLASSLANAEPPKGQGAMLKDADTDGDGKVSLTELQAKRPEMTQEQFTRLDQNKDGFLSPADRKAAGDEFRKVFDEADKDGNKQVTYDELKAVRPNITEDRFKKMDKNGDGFISAADREQAEKPAQPTKKPGEARERFQKADANGDMQLSFEELQVARPKLTKEIFAKMDADSSGALSPDELKSMAEKGKGKKAGMTEGMMSADNQRVAIEKLLSTDGDADGKATFDEVVKAKPGYPKSAYDRFDRNKDGVLSKEDSPA